MKKLTGRVAVVTNNGSEYCTHRIILSAQLSEYGSDVIRFVAQSNADSPDRAYALGLDSSIKLGDWYWAEKLALISKLYKEASKQSAPRAVLLNGKPYLDQCELAKFLQACEKLGLHVSRFSTYDEAYNWSRDLVAEKAS